VDRLELLVGVGSCISVGVVVTVWISIVIHSRYMNVY
jgi:hypothetical protein